MAIDVQAEAKGIAEAYQPSVVDPTMLAADITDLVTRAVAEARREQMERDCKAVCHLCGRPEWTSPDSGGFHHSMTFHQVVTCPGHAIRTAFAATEPRDAGTERGAT